MPLEKSLINCLTEFIYYDGKQLISLKNLTQIFSLALNFSRACRLAYGFLGAHPENSEWPCIP